MKIYILTAFVIVAFIAGCHKDEDIKPVLPDDNKIKELDNSIYGKERSYFSYDSKGRVEKVVTSYAFSPDTTLTPIDTITFHYNDKSQLDYFKVDRIPYAYTHFHYNSDGMIEGKSFNDTSVAGAEYDFVYSYDSKNRLIKIVKKDGESIVLTYNAQGNLESKVNYHKSGDVIMSITYLEYDNKPNPFKSKYFINNDVYQGYATFFLEINIVDNFSENNPTKFEKFYSGLGTTSYYEYSYTYDQKGYWVNKKSLNETFNATDPMIAYF